MAHLDIPILNSLEGVLQDSLNMEGSIRWKKYFKRKEAREENSLQHSYKASLLATIVLDNEKKYSSEPFDAYLVLKATVVHDLGEIEKGDTVYIDKTNEEDKQELNFFQNFITSLPENTKQELDLAYNLQNARKQGFSEVSDRLRKQFPIEVNLFDAIERLGYITFAYREARQGKPKILVQTLRHQAPHLERLANELPGFRATFYTLETQKSVEGFLQQYEGKFIEQKGE